MKIQAVLYFLIFILASLLAITSIYIEIRVLAEYSHFEEPTYYLAQLGFKLKGTQAALAHLVNIITAIIAIIIAAVSFKKMR